MATTREVKEGLQYQGPDEELAYTITSTPWESTPTSPTAKAYDEDNSDADVTVTVLSGSASASGDVITTPIVKSLTLGRTYRIEVKFTVGTNVWEPWFRIKAK